jgi:hypothetical protein
MNGGFNGFHLLPAEYSDASLEKPLLHGSDVIQVHNTLMGNTIFLGQNYLGCNEPDG